MPRGASPLKALVARIDRDELAEEMLSTFQAEIPGYGRLSDTAIRAQVLGVIRHHIDLCLEWIGGGRAPGPRRLEEVRASAIDRAAEGMPLEDLLRAYRIGGTEAWRVLVAEATPEESAELPAAADMLMTYLDRTAGLVAAAYLEEREHHVSEQERELRALLDALLGDEPLDAAHHEAATQLGFTVTGKHVAFAAAIPGEGARPHARTAAALRAAGTLALTEGDRIVGLAMPRRDPARVLPAEAVAVVDSPVTREELAASLTDVRIGVGIALRTGRTGVVPLSALTLDLLLAHAPRVAAELRARVLEPLGPESNGSRGDLRKTVTTYLELDRDRRKTAKALYIHPNTLDNRLRRAEELTGLDLDDPDDLATMVLALHSP